MKMNSPERNRRLEAIHDLMCIGDIAKKKAEEYKKGLITEDQFIAHMEDVEHYIVYSLETLKETRK